MQMVKTLNVIPARNSVTSLEFSIPFCQTLNRQVYPSSRWQSTGDFSLSPGCGKKSIWYEFDKLGFIYPVLSP